MSANKAKSTGPEITLRRELSKLKVRGYRLHAKTNFGRPDLVFSKRKVTVFVHGCYWHRCPHCKLDLPKSNTSFWREKFEHNRERDKRKELGLKKEGWRVIVVWECELKNNAQRIAEDLKLMLSRPA